MKSTGAAGMAIIKDFFSPKILCLIKKDGSLDLPKGHKDSKDINTFATAQRECFEESGIFITPNNLICPNPLKIGRLTFFCATTNQTPEINRNPESGKFEHISFCWLNLNEAERLLPNYLNLIPLIRDIFKMDL